MKRITRRVKVKDSRDEITHKHEGKPDFYLEKFSASGHDRFIFTFTDTQVFSMRLVLKCVVAEHILQLASQT